MLHPILISGFEPGGQLMSTADVENYPGFIEPIKGPWLMDQMRLQAQSVGARIVNDHIVSVDLQAKPFRLEGTETTYTCDALVIATGARAKWLDIPSEAKFKGYGVSACATCDGFFFRGKPVIVVGGGNTAVEEALYLSNLASKVIVVHRRSEFRAERILTERLLSRPNVDFALDCLVDEICGGGDPIGVTHMRVRNVKTGQTFDIEAHGIFIAIGHSPASELFADQIVTEPNGYIKTLPNSTATSIPGVFAAGDVTDDIYRQAVTAAGMGCMAALEAERYLARRGHS
jgi:thioredoxin reductase (NADPH)